MAVGKYQQEFIRTRELLDQLKELVKGYRSGHDGRTEPFICDCRYCRKAEKLLPRKESRRERLLYQKRVKSAIKKKAKT